MQEFVLFGPKERTDVIWMDQEDNKYFVHRLVLEMRSKIFEDLKWEETTIIKSTFSPMATLEFLKLCYCVTLNDYEIPRFVLVEVCKLCFQYDVYTKECTKWLITFIRKANDHELIEICNFAGCFQQDDLFQSLSVIFQNKLFLTQEILPQLSMEFKNGFFMYLYGSKKENYIIEARRDNCGYYLADVLRTTKHEVYLQFQGLKERRWVPKSKTAPLGTRQIQDQISGMTRLKLLDDELSFEDYDSDE